MKTTPNEFRKKVGDLIFNQKVGYTIHQLVLVGEDIDVYDFKVVMFAFSTRCRPDSDETFHQDCVGFPLILYIRHGTASPVRGEEVVSNALLLVEYEGRQNWALAYFKHSYPIEVQEDINRRWKTWGFQDESLE